MPRCKYFEKYQTIAFQFIFDSQNMKKIPLKEKKYYCFVEA